MPYPWKAVWITGASTGIGRELVIQLSAAGIRVAATARSADKLDELARGRDSVVAVPGDVTDPAAMQAAHATVVSRLGPIDLAILNAGVWDETSASSFDARRAAATMSVNYLGLTNALEPLIAGMKGRGAGHIALVSSVAGYRGLPKAAYYAPSKAAAISLAEVLATELGRHGIKVSVVNPGFVETPMTAVNKFPMPFIIPADDAARRILAGLSKGRFEVAFPWQMVALLKFLRVLPYPVYFWLVRNVVAPSAEPAPESDRPQP
jgi:short-subunit dehydrogenase